MEKVKTALDDVEFFFIVICGVIITYILLFGYVIFDYNRQIVLKILLLPEVNINFDVIDLIGKQIYFMHQGILLLIAIALIVIAKKIAKGIKT